MRLAHNRFCGVLAALALLAGCEKPFEPLAPTDIVFSIYGHLDAAADTQWIRVMPIRESLGTLPGAIDAAVTIEEIETGATVVMSDSTFHYLPLLGNVDLYAHNFSTTIPMVPGRHYRLTATRSDGAMASATVQIPPFFSPTLEVSNAFRFPLSQNSVQMALTQGRVRGTRHIGMVLGREDIPERCNWPFTIHQQYLPIIRPATAEGDDHDLQLSWPWPDEVDPRPSYVAGPPPFAGDTVDDRGNDKGGWCNLGPKRVLVIASGEAWPHGAFSELRELSHPASINNIEGRGIGFLAGVQTQIFPFAGCIPIDRSRSCTITFSPASATLKGVVTNGCTGSFLPDVRVRLSDPAANAIRYDTTDISGGFEFLGLAPDAPHSLLLAQRISPSDFIPFEMHNIVLGEAAVDTVHVEMTHQRNCAT